MPNHPVIEACHDEALWKRIGRTANADHPEYLEENVFWPRFEKPVNADKDVALIAKVDGVAVGRLQRRSEHILEVAVEKNQRRRGIGRALIEAAIADARQKGITFLYALEVDPRDDNELLGFLDRLGFTRHNHYSMLADLTQPIPAKAEQQADELTRQGFKARALDNHSPADRQLIIGLQKRFWPAFPGFLPPEEMVTTLLDNGQMAMVLAKGDAIAGFLIGGVRTTIRNRRFVRKADTGLLASIATLEEFRGMGIASSIMVEFVRYLKKQGMRSMLYGGCGPEGSPSRKVAMSVGATKEIRDFVMEKQLA